MNSSSLLDRLAHESLAAEALAEIELVTSAWHRSRATRGLARHLNQHQLSRASALALRGRRPEWRSASLAVIARHSEEPERISVLAKALAAARSVPDIPRRLWLLLLATAAMTPGELDDLSLEVLAGLRGLKDSFDLATLLPDVPDPWVEQAAQLASGIGPQWIRAETWASLAERMVSDGRDEWAGRAIGAARGVTEPTERARSLAAVVGIAQPSEKEELARAALDAATRMHDEGTLSVTLNTLAGALSAEQEPVAWSLANSMARQELRVPALARLASRWRGVDRADRAHEAAEAWGDTADEWARSSAIVRIWDQLPAARREAAHARARSLHDPWARADLLGFLAAHDATEAGLSVLQEGMVAARAAPSGWARSRALTAILDHHET